MDTNSNQNHCPSLIPSGDVLLNRSYVRLSLFETTLDDLSVEESKIWDMPYGTSMTVNIGLPISRVSKSKYSTHHQIERDFNQKKSYIGKDRVVLMNSPRSKITPVKLQILKNSASNISAEMSTEDRHQLKKMGSLLKTNQKEPVLIITKTKHRTLSNRSAPRSIPVLWSQTYVPNTLDSLLTMFENTYGSDIGFLIDAVTSDERAGEYYDGSSIPDESIRYLTDELFTLLLEYLQSQPEWKYRYNVAHAPEWPRYLIGIATKYEQNFELLGYQRGRLVESVTLGPEEELVTEIFSWDRSTYSREDIRETTSELSVEAEISNTLTNELSTESEQELSIGVSGNLGGSMPTEYVKIDFGISPDVQSAMSNSVSTTIENVNEATRSSAEKLKQRFQVTTKTTRETGTETRRTRKFKNPNRGRSLNLHHFETLARYKVATKVNEKPQLVLEVQNPEFSQFDRDWVRAHSGFLYSTLKHEMYKNGIEAAQVLAAHDYLRNHAAAEKKALEEQKRELEQKGSNNETDQYIPLPKASIFATAQRIYEKLLVLTRLEPLNGALETIAEHFANGISPEKLRRADQSIARAAWWSQYTEAYPQLVDLSNEYVKKYKQYNLDNATLTSSQNAKVVELLGALVEPLEDDWLVALKTVGVGVFRGTVAFLLSGWGPWQIVTGPLVTSYVTKLILKPDDMGLGKAMSTARMEYQMFSQKSNAEALAEPLSNPPTDTVSPREYVPPPPRAYSDKELAEADAAFERLRLHLEAYSMYYTNQYYLREDPAERLFRLKMLGVADYIENRILGFSGTKAIYPLRLDSFTTEERSELLKLIPDYSSMNNNAKSYEITIPTAGVTTETILGECEALEPYLSDLRALDLEERSLRNQALRNRLNAEPIPASTPNQPEPEPTNSTDSTEPRVRDFPDT